MNVRATIGLTIDIDEDRDMGLEISNEDIPDYVKEQLIDWIRSMSDDEILSWIDIQEVK